MGNNVHALLEDIFPDFKYVYSSLFVFDIFFFFIYAGDFIMRVDLFLFSDCSTNSFSFSFLTFSNFFIIYLNIKILLFCQQLPTSSFLYFTTTKRPHTHPSFFKTNRAIIRDIPCISDTIFYLRIY